MKAKQNRKSLLAAALSGWLLGGGIGNATAANGSTEVMAGHEAATLDTKVSGELAPRTEIFARQRSTISYDNTINMFALVDLTYALHNGLSGVAEVQFAPSDGIMPRLGLQYNRNLGVAKNFKVFVLTTYGIKDKPSLEVITLLQYTPRLNKTGRMALITQLETVTNIDNGGHNFSIERLRGGIDAYGYMFGLAADLTQTGNDACFRYNIGGFMRKDF